MRLLPTHAEEAQPAGVEPRGLFSFNSLMLTTRGFWFFLATFALLAGSILLGATQLMLLCATLLLWFLSQWFLFQLRLRTMVRRLKVRRTLQTSRGEVKSLWAKQKVEVAIIVESSGWLGLPYVVLSERLPALARVDGEAILCVDGAISAENPMELVYQLMCPSAGWLRFDGVKVQLADLQGFFSYTAFLKDVQEFRVLPTLAVEMSHTTFVKQRNVLPLLGTHRHARPGGSSELLDLRDYLPGDPPKTIAWKISARRDRLITKEFESEVPIRCTLFLDVSSSVRVGPLGETALSRLVEVAAGIAQANESERDLTGLCLFDEDGVQESLRPGRGQKHFLKALSLLTDVASLTPQAPHATVRELLPIAYGVAQDVYPEMLHGEANSFPVMLPFWSPQPSWTIPPGAPRHASRFSPGLHREYRWRKELAAILAVRYNLGMGGLAQLLEIDEQCIYYLQRFLAEHQVVVPYPLYDEDGKYLYASPQKTQVLADALLTAVTRGKENELFVLCVDLLDHSEDLGRLERALCLVQAKHHQVMVLCPWPMGIELPGAKVSTAKDFLSPDLMLQRLCQADLQSAFVRLQRSLGRLGVPMLCAAQGDSVSRVLQHIRRLRVQERGVR